MAQQVKLTYGSLVLGTATVHTPEEASAIMYAQGRTLGQIARCVGKSPTWVAQAIRAQNGGK
jgi:hypothetical protein